MLLFPGFVIVGVGVVVVVDVWCFDVVVERCLKSRERIRADCR